MAAATPQKDRAEALKLTQDRWIVASLETQIAWPLNPQIVEYNGREFLLLPVIRAEGKTKENPFGVDKLPAIALRADGLPVSDAQARAEIMRFASALAWQEGSKLEILFWTGGNLPRQMGVMLNNLGRQYLETDSLQLPESEEARTALALYREGVSLDNPFYSFLSLHKAFCVAVPGRDRAEWIARKREFKDERARKRWAELEGSGQNVGDYLREQGRNAIAHADREPFVDPDRTDDHFRLREDVPLMRALAEAAIEERLGVLKPSTIYRQHLYELEGFRNLLPEGILTAARRGDGIPIPIGTPVCWPRNWHLVAVGGLQRHVLIGIELVAIVWQASGMVVLKFRSKTGAVEAMVALDFPEQRLLFDPLHQLRIRRLRENRAQIEEVLAALRVQFCILGNGHLEVWDANRGKRLGRSDTCIPVNLMLEPKGFDAQVAELEALLTTMGPA